MGQAGRWCTPAEAVEAVRSGDRVFLQSASAYPQRLVDALVDRGRDGSESPLRDVEIVHLHTNGTAEYTEPEFAGRFHHRALFVGANVRSAVAEGRASYVPIFLSDVPDLFLNGHLRIDVAMLHVSPPDEHGFCSLGTSVDCARAAARSARTRIAQVNPRMPRTLGDSFIHVSDLDWITAVDDPLPVLTPLPPTPVDQAIGEHLAQLIPDGATLQLGIGSIPDAALRALMNHRDLGIHSEVISDTVVDLVEAGVITGVRKTVNAGKIVVAFLNGSRRLYDFADDNPIIEMRPVDYTNDTRLISRLDNMIAINSAIEIDLTGQVCAESIGNHIYSGVGGQMDFMRGAAQSRGGKPIIAMPSTARDGRASRIVPALRTGAGVTTTRAHVHYVATEFGVVNLHGLDIEERTHALITLAHPDFQAQLLRDAREMGLIDGSSHGVGHALQHAETLG
jgi:4-hydroxybutyrate CoA-transferase